MSTAICLTRWLCRAVNGSRLSTASASAPIVWVNMSRISTKRFAAIRVVYSGRANSSVAHHSMPYTSAISQASGPSARLLNAVSRMSPLRTAENVRSVRSATTTLTMAVFTNEQGRLPLADRRNEVDQ